MTDADKKSRLEDFVFLYLDGHSKAEQVDALEDLAGELQVRADDLRAEMRAGADDAAPAEPVGEPIAAGDGEES